MSWKVRENAFRGEVEQSEGRITFASGVREQDLSISLKNDAVSARNCSITFGTSIGRHFRENEDEANMGKVQSTLS